jgi:hypothetical protein
MKIGEKHVHNHEFEGKDNIIMWDVIKIIKDSRWKMIRESM